MAAEATREPQEPAETAAGSAPRAPEAGGTVRLDVEYDPCVNYALQQNAVPVVRGVWIENLSDTPIEDVELTIRAEPDLASPVVRRIDRIPGHQGHRLASVDLPLGPARLVNQMEREAGELVVEVRAKGEVVATTRRPLEVLAYGEWAGTRSLPEILAAFVLPNHPEVARILLLAREHLGRATGSPALDGYQSHDPARARAILAAIYAAVSGLEITYVAPPASFEREGQKVRTPDQVVEGGLGTCLDLALLVAAALEQAGLSPLVVLFEGHALPAVWLADDAFVEPIVDDPTRISKRVALGVIEVVEATGLANRPPVPFEEAVALARRRLGSPGSFAYAVDVRAARRHKIRPLPVRLADPTYEAAPELRPVVPAPDARTGDARSTAPPAIPSATGTSPGEGVEANAAPGGAAAEALPVAPLVGAARVERWKRKLLDLTLRNRLLNHRETKTVVPLLCPDVARFEDLLSAGETFTVHPRTRELDGQDPRDPALFANRSGEDLVHSFLLEQMDQRILRAPLDDKDLDRRLVEISRTARTNLEEGGANTLYLAIGFLRWFETPTSTTERRAPILLLPLEISRSSMLERFQFRLADDDPRINVTLLQKLKVDYGLESEGFDELETDDSGLDVRSILQRVRALVLALDRWDVVEEVALGHFSFTKYLMWLDLEKRSHELEENAVVRHLIESPTDPWPVATDLPRPEEIDERWSPGSTFCPLDADSSQLCAVHAAADGATFVLWGPPGTGKSQTITNVIAHAVATGRRVLFVSEKMAALNVVKKRLEQVGLGPFCLELHSNKAQKSKVLAEIQEALHLTAPAPDDGWDRKAERLQGLAKDLDRYAEVLHRRRPAGLSAYQAIARLVGLGDAPLVALDLGDDPETFDAKRLEQLRDQVQAFRTALVEVAPPAEHPWRGATLDAWAPALTADAVARFREVARRASDLDAALGALATPLAVEGKALSRAALLATADVARLLLDAPPVTRAILEASDADALRADVDAWAAAGREEQALSAALLERFSLGVLELDLDRLRARLDLARRSGWPVSWFRARAPRRALRAVAKDRLGRTDALLSDVDRALRVRSLRRLLDGAAARGSAWFGSQWQGADTSWDALVSARDFALALQRATLSAADGDVRRLASVRERAAALATEGQDLLSSDGPLRAALEAAVGAHDALAGAMEAAKALLVLDEDAAWGGSAESGALARIVARAGAAAGRPEALRPWCTWRRVGNEAQRSGLAPLLAAVEEGGVRPAAVERAFERSFTEWWIGRVFQAEPLLRAFDGRQQQDLVRRFGDLDVGVTSESGDVIRARVGARLPRGQREISPSSTSEMGIVRRELMKQRRHMPIRRLLERAPNVVCRLKPCLLMSPLSVAQYLSTDFPRFDLVVFDEASQIPTHDAIGAIARGEALVVVGDPKQLPPTAFFERTDDEEVDEDDVEDLESILDELMGARLPSLRLGWHYRSRHESLIAFSNHQYYENRLLTFPSALATAPDLGVSLVNVEGVYDRGGSRANLAEAKAVVAEIVARLTDPERARYTIGVVTFSLAQQTLVEDLLDQARRENPALEPYFTGGVEEPVFVKNLENVQGDERDVILFSICYGADASGRVALNFGPLNRDGGERRLNVAITRARREVKVYASIRADQIDLARTRAVGMRHLKEFLDYAARGPAALGQALVVAGDAEAESPLEEDVKRAIEAAGFEVVSQVGCSGYRIDLGVKDPDAPGRFLLGVECDGAMYHSAKTARDRDRLRASVLRGLGWVLHRVWSTDWWQDPKRETKRVLDRLQELRRAPRGPPPPPVPPRPRRRRPRPRPRRGPGTLAKTSCPTGPGPTRPRRPVLAGAPRTRPGPSFPARRGTRRTSRTCPRAIPRSSTCPARRLTFDACSSRCCGRRRPSPSRSSGGAWRRPGGSSASRTERRSASRRCSSACPTARPPHPGRRSCGATTRTRRAIGAFACRGRRRTTVGSPKRSRPRRSRTPRR